MSNCGELCWLIAKRYTKNLYIGILFREFSIMKIRRLELRNWKVLNKMTIKKIANFMGGQTKLINEVNTIR